MLVAAGGQSYTNTCIGVAGRTAWPSQTQAWPLPVHVPPRPPLVHAARCSSHYANTQDHSSQSSRPRAGLPSERPHLLALSNTGVASARTPPSRPRVVPHTTPHAIFCIHVSTQDHSPYCSQSRNFLPRAPTAAPLCPLKHTELGRHLAHALERFPIYGPIKMGWPHLLALSNTGVACPYTIAVTLRSRTHLCVVRPDIHCEEEGGGRRGSA